MPPRSSSVRILCVPLIATGKQVGTIYTELGGYYGRFSVQDLDLLKVLGNQSAVAIENAAWARTLEDKVEQRTVELQASKLATEQRNSELAVINSIQQGLAAELDFQAIVDLVGDKLREVLNTGDIGIRWFDPKENQVHYLYEYEHGLRLSIPPAPPQSRLWIRMVETRQPVIMRNQDEMKAAGLALVPGTDQSLSLVMMPIIGSDRVNGAIILEDYEREYAFSEANVRLLQTVAASMGVALENARLFDETQRLLQETEQRAAELAVINSVQAALASELNIQGIYDTVGDKIREIFHNSDLSIRIYDPSTNLEHFPYIYENGLRLVIGPEPLADGGFSGHVIHSRETLVINENMLQAVEKYGSYTMPGTAMEKSAVYVPLIVGDQARGLISLTNLEREHAFTDSDVRLLQTLANSMSVALENARLFNETQRLLKETEQRAAELATVNTLSQALASAAELNALIELTGEQMKRTFAADIVYVALLDEQTKMIHFPYSLRRTDGFPSSG